jgi:hypothetical protein
MQKLTTTAVKQAKPKASFLDFGICEGPRTNWYCNTTQNKARRFKRHPIV